MSLHFFSLSRVCQILLKKTALFRRQEKILISRTIQIANSLPQCLQQFFQLFFCCSACSNNPHSRVGNSCMCNGNYCNANEFCYNGRCNSAAQSNTLINYNLFSL